MEYITIAFIARDQNTAIEQLIALTAKTQCYIEESRFATLGADFTGILRVAGNWNAIAKLEEAIVNISQHTDIVIELKRTKVNKLEGEFLPYLVQVIALDTPDLVHEIITFYSEQNIQIIDFQTDPFKNTHADTTMLTVSMRLNIPARISIADLRERFMILCDELNVDGIMEPEKR